jgi:hypothetical protein
MFIISNDIPNNFSALHGESRGQDIVIISTWETPMYVIRRI